jgi:hypothetical protein
MKTMITGLGLAALVATPAFAQKPTHRAAAQAPAYASAPQPATTVNHGYYIGTDPDPSIRFELDRDAPTYSMGN